METFFKVPIRNLFCFLSYVNDMPELVDSFNDTDEDLITYDFLAKRFNYEAQLLLRKGLIRAYVAKTEETNRLSGRLLMTESMPFILQKKPVVVCEKDEYSSDILLNQIMRTTLEGLYKNQLIKEETRKESYLLWEKLGDISTIPLTKRVFNRIFFQRHTLRYKQMIHIALLLHEIKLLSHKSGNWSLFSAEMDKMSLNQLFEKFLLHFYRIEQSDYRVGSERMTWKLEGDHAFLPKMVTDVSLTHKSLNKKIIIDAKFYKSIFQQNFNKSTFHSGNLYQLFTYLMHQPTEVSLRGILIYPYNGHHVNETYQWNENINMEVMTINLDASWNEIYDRLLDVVNGG